MRLDDLSHDRRAQRAVLAGVIRDDDRNRAEHPLAELRRLARTAGATVVGEVTQRRDKPDSRYHVGKGKAQEVADLAAATKADLVILDMDLSPAQERNLHKLIGVPIVDRTRLILDIFATHARTRQATLQVELAQLDYTRSRLTRMWSHLERERLEGNIGTRGPGEKQLEVDKRLIAKRIQVLRRELEVVERQEATRSQARAPFFKVSLVGYTNAGKSTLLRRLTSAEAFVEDKLFATLDTQTRAWCLPDNQRVFLSDTVGFIRDLPHGLVASFHSTLAEVLRADLLLHVVDASNPDGGHQMRTVDRVLDDLGAGALRRLVVLNKTDAADPMELASMLHANPGAVAVSAETGDGIADLEARVARIVAETSIRMDLRVPASAGRLLAQIADTTRVLERTYDGDEVVLTVLASPRDAARIRLAMDGRPGAGPDGSPKAR